MVQIAFVTLLTFISLSAWLAKFFEVVSIRCTFSMTNQSTLPTQRFTVPAMINWVFVRAFAVKTVIMLAENCRTNIMPYAVKVSTSVVKYCNRMGKVVWSVLENWSIAS